MAPNDSIKRFPTNKEIQLPVATAHLLMDTPADDNSTSPIPSKWSNLNFKAVNVLNISPFIVYKAPEEGEDLTKDQYRAELAKKGYKDGDFILEPRYEKHAEGTKGVEDSAVRLAWLINEARRQNPDIKIIGVQWWGDNNKTLYYLRTEQQINNYVKTVGEIIKDWTLDGWDIDYEWNKGKGPEEDWGENGNLVSNAPRIMKLIRDHLDKLDVTPKRPLYVTMSAATTAFLDKEVCKSVHFVNLQSYSGGDNSFNQLDNWIGLGFTNKQLLYGMCPEDTSVSPTLAMAFDQFDKCKNVKYKDQKLAGIMSWRLNGGEWAFVNAVQKAIYKHLYPEADMQISPDRYKELDAMWEDKDMREGVKW